MSLLTPYVADIVQSDPAIRAELRIINQDFT